jgi:hypothetical protein
MHNDVSKGLFVVAVHVVQCNIGHFLRLGNLSTHSCTIVVTSGQQFCILNQLAVVTKVKIFFLALLLFNFKRRPASSVWLLPDWFSF